MKKLNCFVACAFGKDDVDDIYENGIAKVLKSLNINPLRVDRVDFLGKVDSKIIELIRKADFCIADLTYARPSVYFEAGFAEGLNKKVIYTVNKSHFHPDKEDIYGNLKVHFDLITQNIIGWKSASNNFRTKLAKRINVVIKPILEELRKDEKDLKEQIEFKNLSLSKRIKVIDYNANAFILDKSVNSLKLTPHLFINNQDNKYIYFVSEKNYTKAYLEKYAPFTRKYIYTFLDKLKNYSLGKNTEIIVLYNSLGKINLSTIESVFPYFDKHHDRKEYTFFDYPDIKSFRYIFIDDIKSETDYKNKLALIKGI